MVQFIFSAHHLLKEENRMSRNMNIFYMKLWQSYEIDTLEDLKFCEKLFSENLLQRYLK